MGNFKEKLARFMSGRYGMDQLNNAALFLAFALLVLNLFVKSPVIGGASWVVMILTIWRTYSRNTARRTAENELFMRFWKPVGRRISLTARRVREIKTHRFRTCPHCRAVTRMPRRKGKRVIRCLRCNTEFETRISF